jgi:hypothetical protein
MVGSADIIASPRFHDNSGKRHFTIQIAWPETAAHHLDLPKRRNSIPKLIFIVSRVVLQARHSGQCFGISANQQHYQDGLHGLRGTGYGNETIKSFRFFKF